MTTPRVDYPNRKLSMRHVTCEDSQDMDHWARVALANAKPGDRFSYRPSPYAPSLCEVRAVTESTLQLFDIFDKTEKTIEVDSDMMQLSLGYIAHQFRLWRHGGDSALDIVEMVARDPAFVYSDDPSACHLRDAVPSPAEANAVQVPSARKPRP